MFLQYSNSFEWHILLLLLLLLYLSFNSFNKIFIKCLPYLLTFFLSIVSCVLFMHLWLFGQPLLVYIYIPSKYTDMTSGKFPAESWKCAHYWAQPGCTHGCRGWSKDTGAGKNYRYYHWAALNTEMIRNYLIVNSVYHIYTFCKYSQE